MFETVEIPVWALILILLFAAVTFASHFLFPSVRWYFRRRMEKVVARLNERLERPIEPFRLARRHDMIQRLIYDPHVMEAVAEHARAEGIPEQVAFQQARTYAREIVPAFSATAYFGFAIRLARFLSRSFYRVRLGYFDEAALSQLDKDATVIFVMNHRSNMDYVLVTYLAAERSALSYAVGEWARIWPLQGLIRAMGGYFIRRKSRNPLYRRVLERYVQVATAGGMTQAFFPEGGLSLTGALGPPKLGLLSYVVAGFDPKGGRDVIFVPVALNYDRVLEDRVLLEAAASGERRFRFNLFRMAGFLLRQLRFRLAGRFHRFGYAAVSFGEPLSLRAFTDDRHRDMTRAVAAELMGRLRAVVPVLPVPLVATVLNDADGPLPEAELTARVAALATRLQAGGAHVHVPRGSLDYAAEAGLRHLAARRIVTVADGQVSISEGQGPAVAFYAASIAHLVDAVAAQDAEAKIERDIKLQKHPQY